MRFYRCSEGSTAGAIFHKKVSFPILVVSSTLLLFGLAGCRSSAEKNVSEPLVSLCTVTPAVLRAHTCLNFQKGPQAQCILRLDGYRAPDQILKAAAIDLVAQGKNPIYQEDIVQKMASILTPEETRSINFYTGIGYDMMNVGLRGNVATFNKYANIIYAAASGLNKLEKFAGTVYRGESVDLSMLSSIQNALKVGNLVVEEVFLSTSTRGDLRKDIYSTSKLHLYYTIQSKSGRSIKDMSSFASEEEILFLPGSVFRVLSFNKEMVELPSYLRSSAKAPAIPEYATRVKVELEEIDPS